MDAATGLLYVGNGQYYDPTTGRFLTRDAKPNQPNPYVPWDPTGAIIGPLGLMALLFVRRKKGSKWGVWMVLLLALAGVGMTLAACGGSNDEQQQSSTTVTAVVVPIASNRVEVTLSVDGTFQPPLIVTTPAPANDVIVALCEEAPIATLTLTGAPVPSTGDLTPDDIKILTVFIAGESSSNSVPDDINYQKAWVPRTNGAENQTRI